MAICLFTTKLFDGSGDIVQTVKIADFIQKYIESTSLEELKNEAVIIVVKDDENKKIVNGFVKDINPNIQVKEISEFKKANHTINCCIEAGYPHFEWKKELSFQGGKTPLIVMPEYDHDDQGESALKILGGFDRDRGDVGVIPSPVLLAATEGEVISAEVLRNAFERLDQKLQSYLGKDVESYLAQREQRDFTYQYSHDRTKYPTLYTNCPPDKPYEPYEPYKPEKEAINYGRKYTPVEFFLLEHLMLVGNSAKSQDVLCIGEEPETKLKALTSLKKDLLEKGYTRISFINIDAKSEQVIYPATHKGDDNGKGNKEYRMLYSSSMPFSSMQVLPLMATDIVGVTGDQSLVEAMSAKKLVTYECRNHKKNFVEGYLKAVKNEVLEMALEETLSKKILLLARFLIKPTCYHETVEYKPEEVSSLLDDRNTVEVLKNINRKLVEKSQYFAKIENMLTSAVLPYIRNQDKELNLLSLLNKLCIEINNKKTKSDRWEKRNGAAIQLANLIKDNRINPKNYSLIIDQLEIIKQNEPSWQERSLITKILDIISFGIIPIIRYLFFTRDKTMAYVDEISCSQLAL